MPIPDFQSIMLPLLQFASDGKEHSLQEARDYLAVQFGLTEQERAELLPSGRQAIFTNRVSWSKVYLQRAGLFTSSRRAHFQIAVRGREVLAERVDRIDIKFLERYPEFLEFHSPSRKRPVVDDGANGSGEADQTPEEALESAYQKLRAGLTAELRNRVKASTPKFFEQLVVELLLAMGYGGSRREAGEAIGQAGDEGIDGIINEDRLGLDVIYLQAKRWEGTVGRPELQKFVGALHGKRAKKGVFITTGTFSADARDYVSRIDPKIVLIDGQQLAGLMVDFGIGVTTTTAYEIKRIDSDYFGEE